MVKENKKEKKIERKENKSLKEKLDKSKEYLDKSIDDKKSDDSISFNFSIKVDKDGFSGDGSCIPPKNMNEEDKADMARLIQKSIQDANMFMTQAQNEMKKEQREEQRSEHRDRRFEHSFNMFDIFNNRMFRDNMRGRY